MSNHELQHHGILGMKWGKRNGPPYPLEPGDHSASERKAGWRKSLNERSIKKLEKKAIKKQYKKDRRNGGSFVLPAYRDSTGENYENAVENFRKSVLEDPEYKRLSKNAYDKEKARLLDEKTTWEKLNPGKDINKDFWDNELPDSYWTRPRTIKLFNESQKARNLKEEYVSKKSKEYVNTIKEAKIKDMGVPDELREYAKKYVSENFYDFVWDGNLDYNPDNFYDPTEWRGVDPKKERG